MRPWIPYFLSDTVILSQELPSFTHSLLTSISLYYLCFYLYFQTRLQKEMGQAHEKFANLDEKFKNVETERDGLRKKVKDTEIKIEVR